MLPIIFVSQLKKDDAQRCSQVTIVTIKILVTEEGIDLTRSSPQNGSGSATTSEYCTLVAFPYNIGHQY
jgi:hypothetical protein